MIKSKEETGLMKDIAKYSDFAVKIVAESVQEGVSELEIVGKVTLETLSKMARELKEIDGSMPVWVKVFAGPRTAFPHAFSTTSKVKKGDVILTVVITRAYGYTCGEIARTLFFGKPTEEQKKIYETALKGMALMVNAMKPGATCSDVDRVKHEYLVGSGYGDYIPTKGGALRGLESRDDVYLCEVDQTVLKPTMTFFIGSGICIPGNGGYRLGDMVLVTEKGCESLQRFPSDIESVTIEA